MAGDERTTATIEDLIASGAIVAHKDGNYGSKYPRVEEFGSDGIPFLTAKSLCDGYVDIAGAPRLAEARADELTFGFVESGDVLLSHNATIGRVAVVPPHSGRLLVGTSLTYFRLNPKKLLPRYLAVYMAGSGFQNQLAAVMSHSTRNQVPVTAQRYLHVVVPPLPEQRAIAHILGTLDDKIELNRRMNETLEAMARALFKSWFVDFDPVRAKAEGRDPGLPKPFADFFPARLVDSELGEIPEGWHLRTLDGVCSTVTRGVTPKYEHGSRRYIINQRVNRGAHLDLAELKELASSLHVPADCYAKRWDVLVNCLGEGTLGRVHLFRGSSDEFVVDQHMSICRGETSGAGAYLYQLLASPAGQEKIESLKTGSTGMTMFNISKLRGFDLVWPGDVLVRSYFQIVESELAHVAANDEQSRTLAALRDALMPKLISGELQVRDAERFTARVE